MLSVVIGPGPLALGLIVPCLKQANIDVCLVGRAGSDHPEQTSYLLSWSDPERGLATTLVEYATNAESVADLDDELRGRIASDEPLLITCSLKGGIVEREVFVDDLVAARPAGAETVLIVCENDPDPAYATMRARHGEHMVFCSSVVDRVCNWEEPKYDDDGCKCVCVHLTGEWVIGRPEGANSELLSALANAAEVNVVPVAELPAYDDRKRWTVNGLHFVLAVIARDIPIPAEDLQPVAEKEAFQAIAARLLPVIEAALQQRHSWLPVDRAYGEARVRVFCEMPDYTSRILASFRREDLGPFVARFARRVCAPARIASQAGRDVEVVHEVVRLVVGLIGRERYYPSSAMPTVAIDAEVAAQFAAALEPWTEPDEVERLAKRLERLLEGQRDMAS